MATEVTRPLKRKPADDVHRVAVIGTGTIGASWSAFFLSRGLQVSAYDPAPDAEARLLRMIDQCADGLRRTGGLDITGDRKLEFHDTVADAVREADFVQESGPEDTLRKQALLREISEHAPPATIVASSSSGLLISDLQAGCIQPERIAIGHPFNPPHLMPLVEVVGGLETAQDVIDWLLAFYGSLGKQPIHVRREVKGHIANRLAAALWQEAVSLVTEGVASVADVDRAVRFGPGIRWALMGPHLTYHLGGGEGGLQHLIDHLGPAMEAYWADLGTARLDESTTELLVEGVEEETLGSSIDELARWRDAALVAVLEALKAQ